MGLSNCNEGLPTTALLDTNEYTYNLALASRLVAFLAFVPREHIESAFEDLSVHVAGTYPELMAIVN